MRRSINTLRCIQYLSTLLPIYCNSEKGRCFDDDGNVDCWKTVDARDITRELSRILPRLYYILIGAIGTERVANKRRIVLGIRKTIQSGIH